MNVNRNYYEMQLEGHPLAPAEVDVTNRQLDRFRELVRRGKGRRDFDDDCSYEGSFSGGELNGHGVYTFNDGSTYDGEFKDGWMHGKGIYTVKGRMGGAQDASGKAGVHVFEGDYLDGARDGQGTIKYANKIRFEGTLKGSRCQGKGKLIFPNGDVYEGEFEKDLPHGEGKYFFSNGSVYEGEFAKGHLHGHGQFHFQEGTSYDNDEYLLAGMSIPEKLRIQSGNLAAAFVKGQFYEPSLFAPHPDFDALAAQEEEAEQPPPTAESVPPAEGETATEGGEGGGEGSAPPTADGAPGSADAPSAEAPGE